MAPPTLTLFYGLILYVTVTSVFCSTRTDVHINLGLETGKTKKLPLGLESEQRNPSNKVTDSKNENNVQMKYLNSTSKTKEKINDERRLENKLKLPHALSTDQLMGNRTKIERTSRMSMSIHIEKGHPHSLQNANNLTKPVMISQPSRHVTLKKHGRRRMRNRTLTLAEIIPSTASKRIQYLFGVNKEKDIKNNASQLVILIRQYGRVGDVSRKTVVDILRNGANMHATYTRLPHKLKKVIHYNGTLEEQAGKKGDYVCSVSLIKFTAKSKTSRGRGTHKRHHRPNLRIEVKNYEVLSQKSCFEKQPHTTSDTTTKLVNHLMLQPLNINFIQEFSSIKNTFGDCVIDNSKCKVKITKFDYYGNDKGFKTSKFTADVHLMKNIRNTEKHYVSSVDSVNKTAAIKSVKIYSSEVGLMLPKEHAS